jgi:hypothetical protein
MSFMAGRRAHVAAIGALFVAGCASSKPEQVPVACLAEPATIAQALKRAPARVTLADGTPLSRCVSLAAHRDGDLQALGSLLMRVADDMALQTKSDPSAAVRLGYLVGAVRRGAAKTPGLAAQLARRVEQTAALEQDDAAARGALLAGEAAGEDGG